MCHVCYRCSRTLAAGNKREMMQCSNDYEVNDVERINVIVSVDFERS